MTRARRRVLVAGGGIAGLATAIACSRAGHDVSVFEQAEELTEVGAALTLWPNGVLALRSLGVDASNAGARIATLRIRRAGGGELATIPTSALECDGGFVTAMHRAELVELLRDSVPEGVVALGATVTGFTARDETVEAEIRVDGATRREAGDALVGADGIDSTVRARLLGGGEPKSLHACAWRGVTRPPDGLVPVDEASQVWGRHGEFGWIPLRDGMVYWFAALRLPPARSDGAADERERVLEACGDWAPPVAELVRSTAVDAILVTELRARRVPWRFSRGRVTLAGDAAHAMAPNLGQGACQALEDAVALGRALAGGADAAAALGAYSRARVARTKLVTAMSRVTGELLYVGRRPLPLARDAVLSVAPEALLRQPLRIASRAPRSMR